MSRRSQAGRPDASPGVRHLEEAYDILAEHGHVGAHRAYEMLLDILGHGFSPRPILSRTECPDELYQSVEQPLKKWIEGVLDHDHVSDDLGDLMQLRAMATFDRQGQYLTPMTLSTMMAQMLCGVEDQTSSEPFYKLEPCVGTGRMALAWAEATVRWKRPVVIRAIDVDIRMVRATLINLLLANFWRVKNGGEPIHYQVLWANALEVEVAHPAAWAGANAWRQEHWSTLPAIGSGRPAPATGLGKWMDPAEVALTPTRSVEEARRTRNRPEKVERGARARGAPRQARLGE